MGVRECRARFRAIEFDALPEVEYELHLRLRTASRLLRVVREVPAHSAAMLRSQVRRIHWPELFEARHGFRVDCVGVDSETGPLPSRQVLTQVREGVRDAFTARSGQVPRIDTEEPKVVIVAHLAKGRCTLSFDTTGKALHKRGYRESGHPAPLKETLAAAILQFAGYDGTQAFIDPMCGSGTLAIEAAGIAVHKAAQIHRGKGEFLLEWLSGFDRALWRSTQDRLRAAKLEAPPAPLVAADVDPRYVAMAGRSALKARVEKYVDFRVARVQDAQPPASSGLFVANLPYGDRIDGGESALGDLYGEVGDVLKQRFSGWCAALLAAEASPWKAIGLKPSRSIALVNGSIPCRLLLFELYAGSRRAPRAGADTPA